MAYIMQKVNLNLDFNQLPYKGKLKNGRPVILDKYNQQSDYEQIKTIFYQALKNGISYPYSDMTEEEFQQYYLSNQTFVLKFDISQEINKDISEKENVVGSFYIKPNYPGNCSHICNGGFLVNDQYSGNGACKFMGQRYLVLAKQMGYKGSMFNLVFECNPASLKIWDQLNFQRVGRVPKAFKQRNGEYSDAIQFYFDLENGQIPEPQQDLSQLIQ